MAARCSAVSVATAFSGATRGALLERHGKFLGQRRAVIAFMPTTMPVAVFGQQVHGRAYATDVVLRDARWQDALRPAQA